MLIHHRKRLVAKKLSNSMRARKAAFLRSLRLPPSSLLKDSVEEPDEFQNKQDEGGDEEGGEGRDTEFNLMDYLMMLSPEEAASFTKNNGLPAFFFMTGEQKSKHFAEQNKKYRKELQRAPKRKSKTKKIVKFRQQFYVKLFSKEERASLVGKTKNIKDRYDQDIHFD